MEFSWRFFTGSLVSGEPALQWEQHRNTECNGAPWDLFSGRHPVFHAAPPCAPRASPTSIASGDALRKDKGNGRAQGHGALAILGVFTGAD